MVNSKWKIRPQLRRHKKKEKNEINKWRNPWSKRGIEFISSVAREQMRAKKKKKKKEKKKEKKKKNYKER